MYMYLRDIRLKLILPITSGQVASEESELEEAIRRSLCADYNVVTPSVDSRGIQTPSPTWPEIDLVGPPSRDENSRDIEVRSGTPSPDITLTDGNLTVCSAYDMVNMNIAHKQLLIKLLEIKISLR